MSDLATFKFKTAGQICVSPMRFLVETPVYESFLDGFKAYAESLKIGVGTEDGVDMGPLANERRIPALEGMIEDAVEHGAKIVTGGRRIGHKGYFFEPTVLADVPKEARIMNEEPFGGIGDSGYGSEGGAYAVESYLVTRVVTQLN